jgi:Uncharacterised protein family (UPF0149)
MRRSNLYPEIVLGRLYRTPLHLMSTTNYPGRDPLSEAELDRLSDFLDSLTNPDAMDLETLDGFLCALIAGPEMVMPSEYLPHHFLRDRPSRGRRERK